VLVAMLAGLGGAAAPAVLAASKPKAVIIVGPSASTTSHFLDDGQTIADQAKAAGMDVTTIFHPHATWQRVLDNIQGANLVVYMGHGNGWPSPYAPFQERTKDGFGLDGYDGASANSVTYYGANPIRSNIRLAPNAIVMLVHLCYASGNGEPGMAIPSWSVAAQRVDNFSAGFLDVGARSVFAFGWFQKYDIPDLLMNSDKTMEQIFETRYHGYPSGWIGWDDRYVASERSPGVEMHLDPHPTYGFYRSLVGGFNMSASDWRGSSSANASGSSTSASAPAITGLQVTSTDGTSSDVTTATTASGSTLPTFSPNGDGLHDKLVVSHTLSESAYLKVRITDSNGNLVRKYKIWRKAGTSTSAWNGKTGSGAYVPDGVYTLSYTAKDSSGNVSETQSLKVLVLTAVAFTYADAAMYASDKDNLAADALADIVLNQPATVSVKVFDQHGNKVRTLQAGSKLGSGAYSYSWNGRDGSGSFVPDGWYRLIVHAKTALGAYAEERMVWVGAFQLDPSTLTPQRGSKVKFKVYTTEPLSAVPTLSISQPGLATYTVKLTKVTSVKYKVVVTLKSGGSTGKMLLEVDGVDKNGQSQSYSTSLPLR
jgi:flagellar hook assembly protein FlgD